MRTATRVFGIGSPGEIEMSGIGHTRPVAVDCHDLTEAHHVLAGRGQGIRNRFVVALNWMWNYVTFQRGTRLITGMEGARAEDIA